MKINKKLLTGLLLVLVITIATFLTFSRSDRDFLLPKQEHNESRLSLPDVIPSSHDALPPPKQFTPKTAKERRWLEMGMNMDVESIKFYGRVIDQYGQPVAGAEVPFEIGGSAIGGYKGASKRITDTNGAFSIETEGSSLSFRRVIHPDIEFGYPTVGRPGSWDYSHSGRLGVYGFQPQQGDNQVLWTDTSPEKPYIFKAWRIGKGEGEVAKHLISGGYGKSYEYGKFYTLDFSKPFFEIFSEGKNVGHLHVFFERVANAEGVTQRWEARIIPINGGIQATKDTYMNIAPESGYEPEIHIVREKTGYDAIDNLSNQRYYFKANNGKVYGSLFVAFNAHVRGRFVMDINYKLNPDGERILVQARGERQK